MIDYRYEYWLANVVGLGNTKKIQLHGFYQSAKGVYEANRDQLIATGLVEDSDIDLIMKKKESWNIDKRYQELNKTGVNIITYFSEGFSSILKDIDDCPYLLYYLGDISLLQTEAIAMVGARRCSAYGAHVAEELGFHISKAGFTHVSGMALGVDGHSHIGALRASGKTIAVLGCSVDDIYPPENSDIYYKILKTGLIISEYPPGTKAMAKFFPARNRIIAGLSSVLIVVEAKKRSGSLISADFALAQGRDIYAVPGRMTDPMSFGCNELIRQGAGIISGYDSFLKELSLAKTGGFSGSLELSDNLFLEKEESMVYACLDFYPKNIDEILQETCLGLLEVLSALVKLCDMKLAKESFINTYVKLK